MKKIFIILILFIFILPAVQALAQDKYDYTVLAPLPGVADTAGQTTTLGKYIPAMFNLAIGLSAIAAVLNIVFGGLMYMSTDAVMKKEDGKKRIQNSVYGLVLVIGAWLILYTVNPNLLKFNLNIETIQTKAPAGERGELGSVGGSVTPSYDVDAKVAETCPHCQMRPGVQYRLTPENLAKFDCKTCIPAGVPSFSNNSNVDPAFRAKLQALDNGLKQQGVGWGMTEGFPPTSNHESPCHYTGNCIDARLSSASPSALDVKRFIETARNNGLSPSYEVRTQAEASDMISSLQGLGLANPPVVVNRDATGTHFHMH